MGAREMFYESGLSNSCLAADQDDMSLTRKRLAPSGVQLIQKRITLQ
jgi:hypothetical protein